MQEDIKTLYKKVNDSSISKDYNISIDDITLTNKDIVYGTFKLQEKLCSSSTFQIGECNARMVKVQVAAELGNITGKKLSISQIIKQDALSGKVKLGAFYVDSAVLTANKKYRDIVAYDNIYLFNKDVSKWYESLSFPIKMYDFLVSLCEYIGIACCNSAEDFCNADMIVEKTISTDEIKGITVLKCIAELNGGFFRASTDNIDSIEFMVLSKEVNETIELQLYRSIKKEDYTTAKITGLNIRSENDDIGASVGTSENAYVIEDNFLIYGKKSSDLADIAANIYPLIENITYIPYTATQIGLPYLRCGSKIKYILNDGSSFESYMLQRTLTGTQILSDSITTEGTKTTEKTVGISKEIIKLKGKVNVFKRALEETLSQIENIESSFRSQFKQTENEISNIIQGVATLGNYGLVDFKPVFAVGKDENEPENEKYMEGYDYLNLSTDYLWIKFVSSYKNGTIITSEPLFLYQVYIKSISYYISSSKIEPAGGSWTTEFNTEDWEKGKYIWVKISYNHFNEESQKEILWCNTSVDTPIDIQALLDLKIDKDKLISELNASADVIKFLSNRVIIDSEYFKLSEQGIINILGGKIGDFSIENGNISITNKAFINPTYKDWNLIRDFVRGNKTPTTAQKKVSDFNMDGVINLFDSLAARVLILGNKTIQYYIDTYGYKPKETDILFKINSSDPTKTILFKGTNAWGTLVENYIGINGIKTTSLMADGVRGGVVQTESGADLDSLNDGLANMLWKQCAITAVTTYGSFYNTPRAKYRYTDSVIEICVRGTYVTKTTLAEGQAFCKVTLPISIPDNCNALWWDDTSQVWRRATLGPDGFVKLNSNESIAANHWLSGETLNFVVFRN